MRPYIPPGRAIVVALLASHAASGAILSPNDFPASPRFESVPGNYVLDTNTLELMGPGGLVANGVLSSGIAVFTFANFELDAGARLTTIGSRPAAILSRRDISIGGDGILALAGGGLGGEPRQQGMGPGGGGASTNFFGGAGGGGGFGGQGGRGQLSNPTFDFPGAGGPVNGDLTAALQGGSGGGGGKSNVNFESAGGAGGGGIELGANRHIAIAAAINADGLQGEPRNNNHTAGGGGSGGGILLHARSITNQSAITANGGRGGDGIFENGGGGGGGRIHIASRSGGFDHAGTISVAGGTAPSDFFGAGIPGQPGVITAAPIPEPSTFVSLLTLAACLSQSSRRMRISRQR
jgi:hypothetical protein